MRCPKCNLTYALEQKHQPEGEGFFKNFLRKRSYLHCKACGYFEDVDDYKKQVGSILAIPLKSRIGSFVRNVISIIRRVEDLNIV